LALFIDGANLYSAARSLGFDIDYRKLLNYFAGKGRLIRAFYYTALIEDQEYSPIRTDSMGRRKIKGNMDIELAIDMLEMADQVDHVLLFSGDGDFRRLIEAVQRKGVRVTVISTIKSQPPMVADELRRQADQFLELTELAPEISRVHIPREGDPPREGAPVGPARPPREGYVNRERGDGFAPRPAYPAQPAEPGGDASVISRPGPAFLHKS
jgi:uncharacterized LabA/DUF88 family protein